MRLAVVLSLICAFTVLADLPSPGRKYTTLQRLEEAHLAAVHQARQKFAQERKALPQLGVYTDYRAVLHVHAEDAEHTKGTRAEVLKAAKADSVQVVMFTDHRGPKPDTWSGIRDGVLFIPGSEDDHLLRYPKPGFDLRFLSHLEETPDAKSAGFQGMEIYNRHTDAKDEKAFEEYFRAAMKNPVEWAKLTKLETAYPDEIFAAETDYWPTIIAKWDQEIATHPFTGIAANDAHKNQTYNGVTFDPYEVSFLNVSTHILARELTDVSIRESLRDGRAYVSHDWLCDPSGFSFTAVNNNGVYDIGDSVPMLRNTRLVARLPIAANLKVIHNGAVVSEPAGSQISFTPTEPGAYRLEAWLSVDGEERPWIYANPIYLDKVETAGLKLPPKELAANVDAIKDITYVDGSPADAAKHKLDIYVPKGKSRFPVLIFIHGGSWHSGDRSNYPALANRFAKEGIGVVVPSYRLMPSAPHPAQVDDALAAVDWTIKNIAQYGGDPKRIYVSGHSAGGHLAAYAGLDRKFWPNLKGVLPLSGVYDVSQIGGFKGDPLNASPIQHVQAGAPPFLITYCQNDYPSLPAQARNFDAALRAAGVSSELVYIPNENHISEIVNVYKDDDLTARAILRFIDQHP
ncbi:MAG: alpha/beta fold hydrolase [Bryobacteraceae bacterium]